MPAVPTIVHNINTSCVQDLPTAAVIPMHQETKDDLMHEKTKDNLTLTSDVCNSGIVESIPSKQSIPSCMTKPTVSKPVSSPV